jgi:hypothetical protein
LQLLDAIVAGAVEESPLNDPPQSPAAGACYLVGDTPSGEWTQYPSHLAAFSSAGWRFVPPVLGLSVAVKSTGVVATFRAGGWDLGTVHASRVVIDGNQVVGERAPPIADPAGGAVIDAEARATLEQVLGSLRQHGLIASL